MDFPLDCAVTGETEGGGQTEENILDIGAGGLASLDDIYIYIYIKNMQPFVHPDRFGVSGSDQGVSPLS